MLLKKALSDTRSAMYIMSKLEQLLDRLKESQSWCPYCCGEYAHDNDCILRGMWFDNNHDVMSMDFPILVGQSICNTCLDKDKCVLSKENRYERCEHPTLGEGEELLMSDPPDISSDGEVYWCPCHYDNGPEEY